MVLTQISPSGSPRPGTLIEPSPLSPMTIPGVIISTDLPISLEQLIDKLPEDLVNPSLQIHFPSLSTWVLSPLHFVHTFAELQV